MVFLLFVPVYPAEPANIGGEVLEIILYTVPLSPTDYYPIARPVSHLYNMYPQTVAQKQSPYECLEQTLLSCCELAGGLLFAGALLSSLHYFHYYCSKEVSTKHPSQENLC